MPLALEDAIRHAGTVWMGMNVVIDYKAKPLDFAPPPTLLLQGEYDFGAAASRNWRDIMPIEQEVEIKQSAHYLHLENGEEFGKLVGNFLQRHDPSVSIR